MSPCIERGRHLRLVEPPPLPQPRRYTTRITAASLGRSRPYRLTEDEIVQLMQAAALLMERRA